MAARSTGKPAGEQVDQQSKAESLVSLRTPKRKQRPAWFFVEHGRVGRRLTIRIQQPTGGHRFLALKMHADFSFGGDGRAEVEYDGFVIGRHAQADGIGADTAFPSARRRDAAAGAMRIDTGDQRQSFRGGTLRILAEPADVSAVPQRAGRHPDSIRFRDQHGEEPMRLHLTKPPIRIRRHDGGRFVENVERYIRPELPIDEELQILRDTHDAVGIVATQVRVHQMTADDIGIVLRYPGGDKERTGEIDQWLGTEGRHRTPGKDFENSLRDDRATGPVKREGTSMAFTTTTRTVSAGDRTGTAIELKGDHAFAEVWPSHGFNCLRWRVLGASGTWDDLIFAMPDWEKNPVPTRSGHPVLFPFPNRLRHGRFTHAGTTYQLPLNESSGKHAIHGFTPRIPWRVIESGTTTDSAFVTGEFLISRDAPQAIGFWPADARLRLTYRLFATTLRVEAVVDAADSKELPFGLGYHPYFRPPGGAEDVATWWLQAASGDIWELADNLPTGTKLSANGNLDFRKGQSIGTTALDTAYTSITGEGMSELARLMQPGSAHRLVVVADPSFRELLLFIPQHRKAVAIEPYTCATDAANASDPSAVGWKILKAGEQWRGAVEYRLEMNSSH